MDIEKFERQIQAAQDQLQIVQQQETSRSANPPPELTEEVITQLSVALEELHVAAEELQQRNNELVANREALQLERSRYVELFEEAPDAYLVTDSHSKIVEANSTAESLLNLRRKFIIGKPLSVFVELDYRLEFRTQVDRLQEIGKLTDWEVQLQPRDRDSFPAAMAVSAIHDDKGNAIGFRWLIRDITERKQAEETRHQLAAIQHISELKSQFLQTVSHEFRTPLNVIYLSSQLLERYSQDFKNPKLSPLFNKIRHTVKQMTQVLDDVLIFNGKEPQETSLHPSQLDLALFCSKAIAEQESLDTIGDRQIHFTATGECHCVCLDVKLLKHIVGNLLSNAIKYSPEDSIIEFSLHCEDGLAILKVSDRGIGIPKTDLPNLFELFYRGTNVGTISGTGLGLAIVKKALNLQQGTIAIETSIGVGTTITVTLPLNSTSVGSKKQKLF